ncbi:MAG: cell division protein FtsQ/DivIB [Candidatus Omnitrophica bacterium]|nr:cell division protein FtsQ/DivIB [Candidatus Omnitrophota bacterium]
MLRKKNRKTKLKKKNPVWESVRKTVFKMLILVFTVYFVGFWGRKAVYLLLSNLSCFKLTEVCVKDHFMLEGKEAFEFSRLKPGINIFSLEISPLAKEIKEKHPEYEDVVVKRVLPDSIFILLKERLPVVQIKMVKFYPVDKNSFVIPYPKDIPYSDLPIVIGVEPTEVTLNNFSNSLRIRKAIEIVNLLKRMSFPWRKNVAKINLTSLNDVSMLLDNGIEIKLGSNLQEEKFERLAQVLEEIKVKSISPAFIDLRFKDVIIGPK